MIWHLIMFSNTAISISLIIFAFAVFIAIQNDPKMFEDLKELYSNKLFIILLVIIVTSFASSAAIYYTSNKWQIPTHEPILVMQELDKIKIDKNPSPKNLMEEDF